MHLSTRITVSHVTLSEVNNDYINDAEREKKMIGLLHI